MFLSLNMFTLILSCMIQIYSFPIDTDTLVLDHYAPSFPLMATPKLSKIMDPPPSHTSQHFCKSTRLLHFVYSSYLDSFTSFLDSIHIIF